MNIGIILLIIFEAFVGIASTVYIVVALFGILGYKLYRKMKYGVSWYD